MIVYYGNCRAKEKFENVGSPQAWYLIYSYLYIAKKDTHLCYLFKSSKNVLVRLRISPKHLSCQQYPLATNHNT